MRLGRWRVLGLAVFLSAAMGLASQVEVSPPADLRSEEIVRTRAILSSHFCPCQCGSYLPGSDRSPACFGCSVGKAEVTFIRESIASGSSVADLLLALNQNVLVEVFADYSDPRLPEVWAMAKDVARSAQQHRVVLRSPGRDEGAMRAVQFAECGRGTERFSAWQGRLIDYGGGWDFESLVELARAEGFEVDGFVDCAREIDVSAQVARDRAHALERGLRDFPAVTVNRERVPIRGDALREAIRVVIRDAST